MQLQDHNVYSLAQRAGNPKNSAGGSLVLKLDELMDNEDRSKHVGADGDIKVTYFVMANLWKAVEGSFFQMIDICAT